LARRSVFTIDLTKIEGYGEFPCPLCREIISPDDESGEAYEIIALKPSEDLSLEETTIVCKKCESIIHLQGFERLREIIEAPLLKAT